MRGPTVVAVVLLIFGSLVLAFPGARAADSAVTLRVGDPGSVQTRNVLVEWSYDLWAGPGPLTPVYSTLLLPHPVIDEIRAYIAKGVDADGDGAFETNEYSVFEKNAGANASDVTLYIDFNGVRWHDGVQVTAQDLMFSLQIASLHGQTRDALRALWDDPRAPLYPSNRHLNVDLTLCRPTEAQWQGSSLLPGTGSLRCALRFRLQVPYSQFYDRTLGNLWLLPRHVWEGAGGGRHEDFGLAIYPESDPRAGQGVPTDEMMYKPFDINAALQWAPTDADVIGSGPFRLGTLIPGGPTTLLRNDGYYVGQDPGIIYDARLAPTLHRPFVEAIEFRIYRTAQLAVLALRAGEIDYYHGAIPTEFIPDILYCCPPVRLWSSAGPGFTYLGYNLRRLPFGYTTFPPTDSELDDVGKSFRLAFAHLVDKQTIVRTFLANFGAIGESVVSPANTFWVNSSLPIIPYDVARAAFLMDNAGWIDADGDGWREFPRLGDSRFSILTPSSDFPQIPEVPHPAYWTASAARSIGVNVTAEPMAIGPLIARLQTHDYDMFLGTWHIAGSDPGYLFPLYHCSGAVSGQNYPGYCDSEYDSVIAASERAVNRDERRWLIQWAQGIVMADRPVEPVYFPTLIEATRDDRFVNWSMAGGTVWQYWTWIGVRPLTSLASISLAVQYDTAMASGTRQRIGATVKDGGGRALAGASVSFRILPTEGGLFVDTSGTEVNGTTDDTGAFAATYEAPSVASLRDVSIEVLASHPDAVAPAQRILLVSVFPDGARYLSLRVTLPAGDLTVPESPLPLRLEVRDETGTVIGDAAVMATVNPANGTLNRGSGTSAEMASLVFRPPPDLRATLNYRVAFAAAKPESHPGFANASLLVVYRAETEPLPPHPLPDGVDLVTIGAATAVAVVASAAGAALVWARRLRRGRA